MKHYYYIDHNKEIYTEGWTEKPIDFSNPEATVKIWTFSGSWWTTPVHDVYRERQPFMKIPNGMTREDFRNSLIDQVFEI